LIGFRRTTADPSTAFVAKYAPNFAQDDSGFSAKPRRKTPDWGLSGDVAAAADFVLPADDACNGLGVGDVLFGEDALGKGVGVVGVENGDGALEDDDAVVEVFVDEVHGAAGDFDAVVEGLLLGVEAGEGGQERWVDVEDAIWEGGDECGREQAHVAGEADEVDGMLAEACDQVGVVGFARAAFGDESGGGKAEVAGCGEAGSIGDVGDDDGDFDAGEAAGADGVRDGEEVGTAAGEEDAEAGGARS